jgi:orotidine-5'-phosphate decarboxylase
MTTRIDPPVCIALDVSSLDEAKRLVDGLAGLVPVFKVGLQLFTAVGPAAVEAVHAAGREVFLDLKIGDIPQTAIGAVRSASGLGVRFLTIHSSGGREMVRAAIEAADGGRPNILVVTALTSLNDNSVREIGVGRSVSDQVDAMASLAAEEGAPGIVLGAGEVARVRSAHPGLFLLVPGIRPAGADLGDQKRVGTPAAVVADGADLMVLGRAVTQAPDPTLALEAVLDEIATPERSGGEKGVGVKP